MTGKIRFIIPNMVLKQLRISFTRIVISVVPILLSIMTVCISLVSTGDGNATHGGRQLKNGGGKLINQMLSTGATSMLNVCERENTSKNL